MNTCLSLSLSLIADVELSDFISHLTEAGSHIELGKDGQVLVLAEGSVRVMSTGQDPTGSTVPATILP